MEDYYVGVDVGTGSVRVALVTSHGKIKNVSVCKTTTNNPEFEYYEQSSTEIWASICMCVKKVTSNIEKELIKGIGFDATCSLVALDENGSPVTVSPSGDDEYNIILWMDHRAEKQANYINSKNHKILKYVGGKVSLEMETPKMLWLKQNLPNSWRRAKLLFDLPDFLTWKATGAESRSLCSLVCKWNYYANSAGQSEWVEDFFNEIGLEDLKSDNWRKIGQRVQAPGEPVGSGISNKAAKELGLLAGTPVGTSLIDAHAGGLGMFGCAAPNLPTKILGRLGLICGTSTCHMIVSEKEVFVKGVWGPYYSAMIPGMWLNEGGQSATGKLLDHIIDSHPAKSLIMDNLNPKIHIQQYLTQLLESMARKQNLSDVCYLTQDFHVWPDFHGNRSPVADSTIRGMICGLSLDVTEENLAVLYLSTMQALTYGTKHIIKELMSAGHTVDTLLICGGLSKNQLFIQTQADVLGLPVLVPTEKESVLLGSAILGACAAGTFSSIYSAMVAMGGSARVVLPNMNTHLYHQRKYKVFEKMIKDQIEYREIMKN